MDKLILASGSPRRQELLAQMGIEFEVRPQHVDESFNGLQAGQEALRLAEKKARAYIECGGTEKAAEWVLGADTFVVLEEEFIGKPRNLNEARVMLEKLSAKTHTVITGLALISPRDGKIVLSQCKTSVTFSHMTTEEIEWYLDTGEWQGVAAAYRIQERGALFIESINGSWSNVMGLPINTFYGMLRSNNFNFRT